MQGLHRSALQETISRTIETCQECKDACVVTVRHCLEQGGAYAEPGQIRLLRGCAEICQTATNFMLRGSDMLPVITGACAEISERCAESCGMLGEDPAMRRCAEACRRCAQACAALAAMTY